MDLQRLSLGERMVTVARLLAAEHVRQELHDRPADLAELHALSEQYRAIRGNGFATTSDPMLRQDQFMAGDSLAGQSVDTSAFSDAAISSLIDSRKEAA
jgi:hypothetical protein